MEEQQFLSGKVTKRSLPLVEAGSPNSPRVKRLKLIQGELAQFYDSDEGVRYIAMIELKPGSVRGNHYHEAKDELIYVVNGQVLLLVEDPASKERVALELQAGDLATISPGVAHALKASQPGYAIECSRTRYNPEDVQRYTVVGPIG